MYFYPMYIDDDLIQTIADSSRIVPYIDLPLQHINDRMLKRMLRRVTRAQTVELLERLRHRIPELVLRTTFITGFPGETDEAFQELAAFVREQQFQRVGVFTYSFEESTPSASLDGHLDEQVKQQRRAELMSIQQEVVAELNQQQVGRQLVVLIDRPVPDERGVWIGRTVGDAPDVDGLVFVTEGGQSLASGVMTNCEIVASQQYDLVGVATGNPW
jgi:ribosomal protein S12 methylthiotransferase